MILIRVRDGESLILLFYTIWARGRVPARARVSGLSGKCRAGCQPARPQGPMEPMLRRRAAVGVALAGWLSSPLFAAPGLRASLFTAPSPAAIQVPFRRKFQHLLSPLAGQHLTLPNSSKTAYFRAYGRGSFCPTILKSLCFSMFYAGNPRPIPQFLLALAAFFPHVRRHGNRP